MKRIVFLMLSLGMAVTLHAQWTAKDSVNLQRILNGKEDIKLNMDGGEIRLSSCIRRFLPTGLRMYMIKVYAVHTKRYVPVD